MFRCRTAFGIALVLFLLSSVATHAQVGVYATANGAWFGGVTCPSFARPCAETDGKVKPFGSNFGAYYDFRTLGPIRLGVDARGAVESSNKRADSSAGGPGIVKNYEALGGVRASFHTPIHWLHPYVELAGGFARNNASGLYTNTITINNNVVSPLTQSTFNPATYARYGLVKGFAGVDVPLLPYLSIRAIELGEGEAFGSTPTLQTTTITTSGSTTTSTTVINTRSPDTHGIQSIGAGIVFTFPVGK
ncbi:MAG TPA: hypothetical protein VFW30_10560 [Bryocella sp.]|nr:hypothetical protein [Bryocella sp.]